MATLTTMDHIPDRESLRSMSRSEIQTLCKGCNIRANMRTDDMINALSNLVKEKNDLHLHRSVSERVSSRPHTTSRLNSTKLSSKTTKISAKKTSLEHFEPDTDAESVIDVPASAPPTTRRRAKDSQMRLGKDCPVIGGGSGTSTITRAISRGKERKDKTPMLQEDAIPEENEELGPTAVVAVEPEEHLIATPASVRPLSPIIGAGPDSTSPLPVSAPPHPSSIQLVTLEHRIPGEELLALAARVTELETAIALIPVLKESIAQIPSLQDEIKRLEDVRHVLVSDVARCTQANAELSMRANTLEGQVTGLLAENRTLRDHIASLDTRLHDVTTSANRKESSMPNVITHTQGSNSPKAPVKALEKGKGVETLRFEVGKDAETGQAMETAVGGNQVTRAKPLLLPVAFKNDPNLPNPSPAQPVLGKRPRSPIETPDVSISELPADATQKQREDAELAAMHRLVKPQRKKPRLDLEDEVQPLPFFDHGAGPSSTSTPLRRRTDAPLGFFTEGRAPTPLERTGDKDDSMMSVDMYEPALQVVQGGDTLESNAIAKPSKNHPSGSAGTAPRTPPSKLPHAESSSHPGNLPVGVQDVYDPGFFNGPLPVYSTPSSQLPFPLTTPQAFNATDTTQCATPTLGGPWKLNALLNPTSVSKFGDKAQQPGTPGSIQSVVPSHARPPQSPGDFTFRTGGRKGRDDKYNPYFTPPRGSGARHRTGITPTRGFSVSLRSPAKMETVLEGPEGETDNGVVRLAPQLETLYGTELGRETRFGDYGRELDCFD